MFFLICMQSHITAMIKPPMLTNMTDFMMVWLYHLVLLLPSNASMICDKVSISDCNISNVVSIEVNLLSKCSIFQVLPWLREPIPENSESAINYFADLLASFLKDRIDALASNLAILLPHCTLFKVIKSTKTIIKLFILIVLVGLWTFNHKAVTFEHVLK